MYIKSVKEPVGGGGEERNPQPFIKLLFTFGAKVIAVLDPEFQIIITRFKYIFINKIGTIAINTFLTMRNKFVYSYSIKIHASGFDGLSESILCIRLVMKTFSLQKVVKILEELVIGWKEVW